MDANTIPRIAMSSSIYTQLSALSEPTRVRLLRLLEVEELGVGELARILQIPQSTVSRHLKVLREDGWVSARRVGTASLLRLDQLSDLLLDLFTIPGLHFHQQLIQFLE